MMLRAPLANTAAAKKYDPIAAREHSLATLCPSKSSLIVIPTARQQTPDSQITIGRSDGDALPTRDSPDALLLVATRIDPSEHSPIANLISALTPPARKLLGVMPRVQVHQDTIDIDIFSPQRQDWMDGTADYFSKE
jgi:hypothetical protein